MQIWGNRLAGFVLVLVAALGGGPALAQAVGQSLVFTVEGAEVRSASCYNRTTGERQRFVPPAGTAGAPVSWDCAQVLTVHGVNPGDTVIAVFDGVAADYAPATTPAVVVPPVVGPEMEVAGGTAVRGFCNNRSRYRHGLVPVTLEPTGFWFFYCANHLPVSTGDRISAGMEVVADTAAAPAPVAP